MSLWLFNTCMDECIRKACSENKGILPSNINANVPLYADDSMLLAENPNDLQ